MNGVGTGEEAYILINHLNKRCVVRSGSKNGHQKDVHLKKRLALNVVNQSRFNSQL